MDGESTNAVTVIGEDGTTEFSTIPSMMEFEEPETLNPVTVNKEPVEMEPEPQQEPIAESSVPPAVSTAATTVTAIRLGSGADDNPTMAASDVEEKNMDGRARRTRSRGRRSRRGRSRSRRSRSRSRSRRSRSRSNYGDFYVQIADDEISAEPAGSSRGSQKTARGGRRAKKLAITGRRGRKASHESCVSKKAIRGTLGGWKSARGSRRGRKTTEYVTARTIWSERLRPLSLLQNKKSKAK